MREASAKMYECLRLRDECNAVAKGLSPTLAVFASISLRMPRLNSGEIGFLHAVSWLFVLFFEAGRPSVSFIESHFVRQGLDPERKSSSLLTLVNRLRTYLQHNLDPTSVGDSATARTCEEWFRVVCGTPVPADDGHWVMLVDELVSRSVSCMEDLHRAVRNIERDPARSSIVQEWVRRVTRFHPPHEFDAILSEVAGDLGRESLDITKFRKRHYDRWCVSLDSLADGYDFALEVRRLAETAMLTDFQASMPITAKDLFDMFEVVPGPGIGQLLSLARNLYLAKPCTKDELLARLWESDQWPDNVPRRRIDMMATSSGRDAATGGTEDNPTQSGGGPQAGDSRTEQQGTASN